MIFYSFTGNSGLTNQIEGRIVRSQEIHDKHVYLLLSSKEEYNVLDEACKSTSERLAHTKSEISLLNNFFLDKGLVNSVVAISKQAISEGASSSIVGVSYSSDNLEGQLFYPDWVEREKQEVILK